MTLVAEVDPARPEVAAEALAAAGRAIDSGGLVVFPTETVYGLATRPDARDATARLFRAKRRPAGLNVPVLVPSAEIAWSIAVPTPEAERLAQAFWPGPLTMVLGRAARSASWSLGERETTVGVRVPDHRLSLALIGRAGPLAATSANLSGRPPLSDPAELVGVFGDVVDVFLVAVRDAADAPAGRSSTVVDLTGPRPRILRPGPIEAARIEETLGAGLAESTRPVPGGQGGPTR